MMRHRSIQRSLFDYVKGEVPERVAFRLREHLLSCPECARDVEHYRRSLDNLGSAISQPADKLPPGYWNAFASGVMHRITVGPQPVIATQSWWESLIEKFDLRPAQCAAALGTAVAILMVSIFVWKASRPDDEYTTVPGPTEHVQVEPASTSQIQTDRVNQYFRRSRLLLVGLSNMEPAESGPVDLTAEMNLSRELVREARELRNAPLDARSARLMGDMERIFIELANAEDRKHTATIELIRSGIRRENLLFKVRMAETMYDSALIAYVKTRYRE